MTSEELKMTNHNNNEGTGTADHRDAMALTHPTCKVCASPRRREIEVELLVGGSRQAIAERFSGEDQAFNRQNLFSHFHNHMDVVEQAVVQLARQERRRRSLDVATARRILLSKTQFHEDLLEIGMAAIAEGRVKWTLGGVLATKAELDKLRDAEDAAAIALIMERFNLFVEAVKEHVPEDQFRQLYELYKQMAEALSDDPWPLRIDTGGDEEAVAG
jgi:hypothetical protein